MEYGYEDYVALYPDPDGLTEQQFGSYLPSAAAYIDVITHNRAADAAGYKAQRVKWAVCAVVREMAAQDAVKNAQGVRLSSVSNDGYTESYAADGRSDGERIRSAAMQYLSGTGLVSFL